MGLTPEQSDSDVVKAMLAALKRTTNRAERGAVIEAAATALAAHVAENHEDDLEVDEVNALVDSVKKYSDRYRPPRTISNGYSQESGEGFDPIEANKLAADEAAEAEQIYRDSKA